MQTDCLVQKNYRLLIIEDDADLREGLQFSFLGDGFEVACAGTKAEGVCEIRRGNTDCVLLDCNLPDGTGFEVCREVRRFSNVPIIMLTARDTEMDEIMALELGVDDYLSKPFSLGVLKARMKRILNSRAEVNELVSGGITIDKSTCRVCRDGEELALSKLEYRLLCFLVENKNHVLSKEQILERLWDSEGKYVDNNTVSVNISRLRKKLKGDAGGAELIRTIQGVGYIWKEE